MSCAADLAQWGELAKDVLLGLAICMMAYGIFVK